MELFGGCWVPLSTLTPSRNPPSSGGSRAPLSRMDKSRKFGEQIPSLTSRNPTGEGGRLRFFSQVSRASGTKTGSGHPASATMYGAGRLNPSRGEPKDDGEVPELLGVVPNAAAASGELDAGIAIGRVIAAVGWIIVLRGDVIGGIEQPKLLIVQDFFCCGEKVLNNVRCPLQCLCGAWGWGWGQWM